MYVEPAQHVIIEDKKGAAAHLSEPGEFVIVA